MSSSNRAADRQCRKSHEFHFRSFLFGTGVALDAFELRDGNPAGYQFQVIAEPERPTRVLAD